MQLVDEKRLVRKLTLYRLQMSLCVLWYISYPHPLIIPLDGHLAVAIMSRVYVDIPSLRRVEARLDGVLSFPCSLAASQNVPFASPSRHLVILPAKILGATLRSGRTSGLRFG